MRNSFKFMDEQQNRKKGGEHICDDHKPEHGQLAYSASENGVEELNDQSLDRIVTEVKDWYSKKQVA